MNFQEKQALKKSFATAYKQASNSVKNGVSKSLPNGTKRIKVIQKLVSLLLTQDDVLTVIFCLTKALRTKG